MIISHKHRFIFIANGKTGTTSIEAVLKELDEGCDFNLGMPGLWHRKHMPPAVIKSILPEAIWENYYKFVFVRHPIDWFVSQYRFNFSRQPKPSIIKFVRGPSFFQRMPKRLFNYRKSLEEYREIRKNNSKKVLDSSNVDFLYNYLRRYRALPLSDSLFQSNYTDSMDGKQLVDFVGRFEDMKSSLEVISQRIEVPLKIPHKNPSPRASAAESLSEEALARISELWRRDFDRFGYEVAVPSAGILASDYRSNNIESRW